MHRLLRICLIALPALALIAALPGKAYARLALIRDAEIEHTLRDYATPLLKAASLDPQAVYIHIVNDQRINAFVAGGQRIFIFTGLIDKAQTADQLIGVLAHEIGHIEGGHLARNLDARNRLSAEQMLTFLLGAAAAIGGGGQAGAAIVAGGQSMSARNYLSFSRAQESTADQAAATLLERAGISGRGYLEFLDILGDQEMLLAEQQDPYARTHPISSDRIERLRQRVEKAPHYDTPTDPARQQALERMQAKLRAFINRPEKTFSQYPEEDDSFPARYARAIAYFRIPELEKAITILDGLIGEKPRDPYLWELKGQFYYENGAIEKSIPPYRQAVALMPEEPLLLLGLGQSLLAAPTPENVGEARAVLEKVTRLDPFLPATWRLLGEAYARQGEEAMAQFASAEYALLTGHRRRALDLARRAAMGLPKGSPAWLRNQDIINYAQKDKDK